MKEENRIVCGKCGTVAQIKIVDGQSEWYCPHCCCTTVLQNDFYPCCQVCLSPIIPIIDIRGFLDGICSNSHCLGYVHEYHFDYDHNIIIFSSLFFDFSLICHRYIDWEEFHINIKYRNPKKYGLGGSVAYHNLINKIDGNYIEKFLNKVFNNLCER